MASLDLNARDLRLQGAKQLYEAFAARDPQALISLLEPDFRGVVSAGMPNGLGGVYEGAEAMLGECWGRVLQLLDTCPVPEDYLPVVDSERIVVLGHYRGRAHASGRPHEASFAHVLRFRGERITELVQITDTARWHEALAPERTV